MGPAISGTGQGNDPAISGDGSRAQCGWMGQVKRKGSTSLSAIYQGTGQGKDPATYIRDRSREVSCYIYPGRIKGRILLYPGQVKGRILLYPGRVKGRILPFQGTGQGKDPAISGEQVKGPVCLDGVGPSSCPSSHSLTWVTSALFSISKIKKYLNSPYYYLLLLLLLLLKGTVSREWVFR